jgi:hypothetical protein
MAAPLIAAGIMAGASLLGSGIQSYYANKANEEELEAKKEAANKLYNQGQLTQNEYMAVLGQIDSYYANRRGSIGSKNDVNAYTNAIRSYNPQDYVETASQTPFDWESNHSKEDYLNPYYSRIIGDTANSIQHTAAGAGLGRGSGAALNIAKGVSEKSDELYRTALADYKDDRNFAYQQYQDRISNNQNRLNALNNATQYKIGQQGNLANDYMNYQDAWQSDRLKAQQDKLASKQAYDIAITGLY